MIHYIELEWFRLQHRTAVGPKRFNSRQRLKQPTIASHSDPKHKERSGFNMYMPPVPYIVGQGGIDQPSTYIYTTGRRTTFEDCSPVLADKTRRNRAICPQNRTCSYCKGYRLEPVPHATIPCIVTRGHQFAVSPGRSVATMVGVIVTFVHTVKFPPLKSQEG